jgi:putative tryptophan/tyrosine transport system substrate-binding protein
MAVELTPKRIEIMKEAIPGLAKIALIVNMSDADGVKRYIEVVQEVSKLLGVTVGRFEVRETKDFDGWANLLRKSIPEWPRRAH